MPFQHPPHNLHERKVQINGDFLNVLGVNSFHRGNSASRLHMASNQLGQILTLKEPDVKRIQSGMEREFGKYTDNVQLPCDCEIIDIIPLYPLAAIDPQQTVIFENIHTKEIGCVHLTNYKSNHQYFGFPYVDGKDANRLHKGAHFQKGDVLRESTTITPDGDYKFGVNANVCYMTHPATSEDGVLIRRKFLEKMNYFTYEERVIEVGPNEVFLNLYGTEDRHQAWPEIGQKVHESGLLAATRQTTPENLCVVERSRKDMMDLNVNFDNSIYVSGGGGMVVDVRVEHDITQSNTAAVNVDEQAQRYDQWIRAYYKHVYDLYMQLKKRRGDALRLHPDFHILTVRAVASVNQGIGPRVQLTYKQIPMEVYRIKFIVAFENTPHIGNKLSDVCGG